MGRIWFWTEQGDTVNQDADADKDKGDGPRRIISNFIQVNDCVDET